MTATAKLHRSRARSWAWAVETEPTMKLVLLAIARTGSTVATEEILLLTCVTPASLERTLAKLDDAGLLDRISDVLEHGFDKEAEV
jgi:DNA-binding MarR family transcriptional regulator